MIRRRSVCLGGSALAAALLLMAGPAMAAAGHPAAVHPAATRQAPVAPTASVRATGPVPAAAVTTDQLFGDSCVSLNGGRFACYAAGYFVGSGRLQPLTLRWTQGGSWTALTGATVTGDAVNAPNELACATPDKIKVSCLMVGQHYTTPPAISQLAESWTGSAWVNHSPRTPPASTWASLQDVSCLAGLSCVLVGEAGTWRSTASGVVYTGHATAYRSAGSALTLLSVPQPAGAKTSELAGVACASIANCMAVGNYTNAKGTWLPYAAQWKGGAWHLRSTPAVARQASTTFNAVACPSAALCVAVGVSAGPGGHAFAEKFSTGGWHLMATPAANQAGLSGVTCPAVSRCFAAGWRGKAGLIETWNGSAWTIQNTPATPAAFSGNGLLHVSCATAAQCVAVGFRFNPAVAAASRTYRTLAEIWNGSTWQPQATPNK